MDFYTTERPKNLTGVDFKINYESERADLVTMTRPLSRFLLHYRVRKYLHIYFYSTIISNASENSIFPHLSLKRD